MLNWFDLMRQAQANAGFDVLTRQFRLSEDQAEKAMLAFLPAFALGLQRLMAAAAQNPLAQHVPNPFEPFWQAAGQTLSAQAQRSGEQLIDSLFGSDEASRRIAHRAAEVTGLSVDLMHQMLPVMAGILAGTLHGMMTGQGRMPDFRASPPPKDADSAAAEPWTAFWDGWMQAFQAPRQAEGPAAGKPRPSTGKAEPPEREASSETWEGMMQKGQEMQMQYLASLRSILDETWKPSKP
ncbi:DUF937 domain-containing protein [Microvirga thermotolerans]|uniref:DUF937 domain-containing protein n=1 Tax=Microvirga thermotolerans TaxID=2651334 RepID=A0A5P9JX39_9HYPH|nr:DUF937 domain-containing protein [Microvirga thermotolerans]QFU15785.1 hypothetical protein GDR74_05870 [Microvirga thermotolerans]